MSSTALPIVGQTPLPPIAHHGGSKIGRQVSLVVMLFGVALFGAALAGRPVGQGWTALLLCFGPWALGALGYIVSTYHGTVPGIMHDGTMFSGAKSRGAVGITLGVLITGFYVCLYWFPKYVMGAAALLEPLSQVLRGRSSDQWFLYGFMYTVAVIVMGVRMFYRYRHNRYHLIRTGSVMFFQLGFAFLLPAFLLKMQQPEFYFTYFWPLKPEYLFPSKVTDLTNVSGGIGVFMIFWGAIASFIATPVLTYFYGKRWYCSWVCGCGGLAETLGDPFRHQSNKSYAAWRFERWSIHTVLVLIAVVTGMLWINSATQGAVFGQASVTASSWYGFVVGSMLSGVVGVGFYPLMGSRVWCRFFCPMAAVLGLFQRFFSRFRITTNGDQCMSCGNCSTYCEMGIDVRSYAMRGDNIVRASCVGCGVCAAVCPRGVLKLEGGAKNDRFDGAANPVSDFIGAIKRP